MLIVISAILSWVPALAESIVGVWIDKLVDPFLNLFRKGPIRKLIYGTGIDLSPVVALLVLYVAQYLVESLGSKFI